MHTQLCLTAHKNPTLLLLNNSRFGSQCPCYKNFKNRDAILKHWEILRGVRATDTSLMKSHIVKHFFSWTEEENKAVKPLYQFSSNINPFQTIPNHSKWQVCEKMNCLKVCFRLFSPQTSCWLLAIVVGWKLLLNLVITTSIHF